MRADAARNREKVLEAARELFAAQGYDVPLDEIAAKAGVGPGTVYRHFPTKQALFQAVTETRVAAMMHGSFGEAALVEKGAGAFGDAEDVGARPAEFRHFRKPPSRTACGRG